MVVTVFFGAQVCPGGDLFPPKVGGPTVQFPFHFSFSLEGMCRFAEAKSEPDLAS